MMWNRHVPPELRHTPSRLFMMIDLLALAALIVLVFGTLFIDALR